MKQTPCQMQQLELAGGRICMFNHSDYTTKAKSELKFSIGGTSLPYLFFFFKLSDISPSQYWLEHSICPTTPPPPS